MDPTLVWDKEGITSFTRVSSYVKMCLCEFFGVSAGDLGEEGTPGALLAGEIQTLDKIQEDWSGFLGCWLFFIEKSWPFLFLWKLAAHATDCSIGEVEFFLYARGNGHAGITSGRMLGFASCLDKRGGLARLVWEE